MSRPLLIALVASFCLAFTGRADEPDPAKLPAVKKALEKADGDFRRHRKTFEDAKAKVVADAEKALKAEVERLSKAGKPEEAVAVKKLLDNLNERFADDAALPKDQEWVVLFRSADPSVWNTDTNEKNSFAMPLALAPAGIRYLRVRHKTGEAVIIPMSNDRLDKNTALTKNYGWDGVNKMIFAGFHLGIYDLRSKPKDGDVLVSAEPFHMGWGFGHRHTVNGQGVGWGTMALPNDTIEISVKCSVLTPGEKKILLEE